MVHARMLFGSTQVAASKKVSAASFLSDRVQTTPYNSNLTQNKNTVNSFDRKKPSNRAILKLNSLFYFKNALNMGLMLA